MIQQEERIKVDLNKLVAHVVLRGNDYILKNSDQKEIGRIKKEPGNLFKIQQEVYRMGLNYFQEGTTLSNVGKHLKENWIAYFALEKKMEEAKRKMKELSFSEVEQKKLKRLFIKPWELNQPDMSKENIMQRYMTICYMILKKKNKCSSGSIETDAYSRLLKGHIKTIQEKDGRFLATTYGNEKKVVSQLHIKTMITKQFNQFLQQFQGIDTLVTEDTLFYLESYLIYYSNVEVYCHLLDLKILEQNMSQYKDILGKKLKTIETEYGALSASEFELIYQCFKKADYIIRLDDDGILEHIGTTYLFRGKTQMKKKSGCQSLFYNNVKRFLREVDKRKMDVMTPLFTSIVTHARWVAKQNNLYVALQSEEVPQIMKPIEMKKVKTMK